jgi:hypothetical protein
MVIVLNGEECLYISCPVTSRQKCTHILKHDPWIFWTFAIPWSSSPYYVCYQASMVHVRPGFFREIKCHEILWSEASIYIPTFGKLLSSSSGNDIIHWAWRQRFSKHFASTLNWYSYERLPERNWSSSIHTLCFEDRRPIKYMTVQLKMFFITVEI